MEYALHVFQGVPSHQQHYYHTYKKNINPKIYCIQEVFKTKNYRNRNQIIRREVLPCAIQEMKPQCFRYFEISNTANIDKYVILKYVHSGLYKSDY